MAAKPELWVGGLGFKDGVDAIAGAHVMSAQLLVLDRRVQRGPSVGRYQCRVADGNLGPAGGLGFKDGVDETTDVHVISVQLLVVDWRVRWSLPLRWGGG